MFGKKKKEPEQQGYAPLAEPGLARTDIKCTECNRSFITQLDFSLTGNHVIRCPYESCGHEHYRVIKGGVITDVRWSPGMPRIDVTPESVWKAPDAPIAPSTAAQFIRDAWLNRSGGAL